MTSSKADTRALTSSLRAGTGSPGRHPTRAGGDDTAMIARAPLGEPAAWFETAPISGKSDRTDNPGTGSIWHRHRRNRIGHASDDPGAGVPDPSPRPVRDTRTGGDTTPGRR